MSGLTESVQLSSNAIVTSLRQALDRGGTLKAAEKIATGHNADDIAETVLLNILRGDLPRHALGGSQQQHFI